MTRINTNVNSLVAQNTLGRSNQSLQQALTRLSTGLRINTGKDDPAGLIASENLRSDITSIRKAITNTDRANQVIATADSALGQVSTLLNDIRGLVTEAANTGALSDAQIAANQLQLDSSLQALNRIAQTTTFQGRRLLDGSLDFLTTAGTGFGTVASLKIDQANLGATGQVAVAVNISSAATKAQITNTAIPAGSGLGIGATADLTFSDAATQATGTFTTSAVAEVLATDTSATLTNGGTLTVTAVSGGIAGGATGNTYDVDFIDSNDSGAAVNSVVLNGTTIEVTADLTSGVTLNAIKAAIDAEDLGSGVGADFTTSVTGGASNVVAADEAAAVVALGGGVTAVAANTITVTALAGGAAEGLAGNSIDIDIVDGLAGTAVLSGSTLTVTADISGGIGSDAIAALIQASGSGLDFTASSSGTDDLVAGDETLHTNPLSGGADAGGDDVISVTADAVGTSANGVTVTIQEANGHGAATAALVSGNIVVTVDDTAATTIADIADAIDGLAGYSAEVTATSDGDGDYATGTDDAVTGTLANGADAGGLDSAIVFEVAGSTGGEVLSFNEGTGLTDIVSAINAVSDATGVTAAANAGNLVLSSSDYGSDAFVKVNVLSGDGNGTFAGGLSTTRDTGTDVAATINGLQAKGAGNEISINTATLVLNLTVDDGSSTDVNFTITGGGALFQLGPDVVSNQQARIGITSVNTARLGGASGQLFSLGSGGSAALNADTTAAGRIVEEAINQVTSLRGRLGAFQRTSLETNKNALNDTLVNLSDAESQIRDADFATETAALTRAQILVQSGTAVLKISNQNPQNVLSLLQ
jgi:flagellin